MPSCSAIEIYSHLYFLQPGYITDFSWTLKSALPHCRPNGSVSVHPQNELHHLQGGEPRGEQNEGDAAASLSMHAFRKDAKVLRQHLLEHKHSVIKHLLKDTFKMKLFRSFAI